MTQWVCQSYRLNRMYNKKKLCSMGIFSPLLRYIGELIMELPLSISDSTSRSRFSYIWSRLAIQRCWSLKWSIVLKIAHWQGGKNERLMEQDIPRYIITIVMWIFFREGKRFTIATSPLDQWYANIWLFDP